MELRLQSLRLQKPMRCCASSTELACGLLAILKEKTQTSGVLYSLDDGLTFTWSPTGMIGIRVGFVGRAAGTSPIIGSTDGRSWTAVGGADLDIERVNDIAVAELNSTAVVIVTVGDNAPRKGKMSQIVVSHDGGATWVDVPRPSFFCTCSQL